MNKQNTFNDFRFEGLDYKEASNKYLTLYECLELLSKKTGEKYVWKFVVVEYFSYVGNINNKRRRLLGYL